jgi:CTP synthase
MPRRKPKTSKKVSKKTVKYIFVTGGVISGVGKGIAAASIGKILQARGFAVTAVKIDPYVNVDAGTMNPTEHGEVFVLDDGMECDQDMGNYERFLDVNLTKANYMTTGSIYLDVITKERNLEYHGKCVEVVPQVPMAVLEKIQNAARLSNAEVVIVEVGGTVGEYQNILFLEAIRMQKFKTPADVLLVLVSLLPALEAGGTEIKSKPTQYAIRTLNAAGLQPDIVIARARVPLDQKRKQTIALNGNLNVEDVISAPNVESVYEVPLNFERDGITKLLLKKLSLKPKRHDLHEWRRLANAVKHPKGAVRIGIVGKYFGTGDFVLTDSYISILESIKHAAYAFRAKPEIVWINSEDFEKNPKALRVLGDLDGVIIPGGFGSRGVEGKIAAIQYLRENKIPYFGLCYGMQLAVVEFARHVLKLEKAHTTEISRKTEHPVIDILPEQKKLMALKNYGGTMRLGAYPAVLVEGSIAAGAYGSRKISERHRHRYEVNPEYIARLEKHGMVFSGRSPNKRLMEIMELPKSAHPFFLGTQFHPELKSRPIHPHPLFREFVKAAIAQRKKKA